MGILAVDSVSSTEVDPWLFRESPSGGEAVGAGCGLPGTQAQLELVLAGGVAVPLGWSGLGYRVKSSARGGKEPQEWPLTGMALWGRWWPRHLVGWSDSGGGRRARPSTAAPALQHSPGNGVWGPGALPGGAGWNGQTRAGSPLSSSPQSMCNPLPQNWGSGVLAPSKGLG